MCVPQWLTGFRAGKPQHFQDSVSLGSALITRALFASLPGRNAAWADGEPWHDLQVQGRHWQRVMKALGLRYREPYQMRHTSATWNLMVGNNLLWVAENHGHSPFVMLRVYVKWLKGTSLKHVAAIQAVMPRTSVLCGLPAQVLVVPPLDPVGD